LDQLGIEENSRNGAALHQTGWYEAIANSDFRIGKPQPVFPRREIITHGDDS
jgi:methionyl-tRNA synthetase